MQRPCAEPLFARPRTQVPGCIKAAALEAKLDEKGVPGMKPVVGKKGKKAVGLKQKMPLVCKKAAVTKTPAAEKKPRKETQHRRSLRHKLKCVYSIKVKSL